MKEEKIREILVDLVLNHSTTCNDSIIDCAVRDIKKVIEGEKYESSV